MIIHQKYKYAKLTHLDIQTLKQIYHLKKTCYNIIKRGDTLNRKFKIIIALIALVLCITQIQQTYAKYTESKEGDTDFSIAKWKILVNNNDITESATMSSLINPVYIKNENVKEDVTVKADWAEDKAGLDRFAPAAADNNLDTNGDGKVSCDEYYGTTGLEWSDKLNACVVSSTGDAVVTIPNTATK